jgi:hypothetical protein
VLLLDPLLRTARIASKPARKPLFANRFPSTDIARHKKTAPALFLPVAV